MFGNSSELFANNSQGFRNSSGDFMNSSGDFMNSSGDFRNSSGDFMNRSGNFMNRSGILTETSNKEADAPPNSYWIVLAEVVHSLALHGHIFTEYASQMIHVWYIYLHLPHK